MSRDRCSGSAIRQAYLEGELPLLAEFFQSMKERIFRIVDVRAFGTNSVEFKYFEISASL